MSAARTMPTAEVVAEQLVEQLHQEATNDRGIPACEGPGPTGWRQFLMWESLCAQSRNEVQAARVEARMEQKLCLECGEDLDDDNPETCSRCRAEIAMDRAEYFREED